MGLQNRVARIERVAGLSADQRAAASLQSLQLRCRIADNFLRLVPGYRRVAREDCADDEAWNEIRILVAMADGDLAEASRLESLPAPRRDERSAWIARAPTPAARLQRLGMEHEGTGPLRDALQRATNRRGGKGGQS